MENKTYWKVEDMAIGDFIEVEVINKKGDKNLDGSIIRGTIVELVPSHNMVKLHTEWCCHTTDKLLRHIPKVEMITLRRKEQLAQLDYWGSECRKCAEHHDYSCETGCPHQQRCELAYQQIKERIQKDLVKLHEANIKWIEDIIEIVLESVSCDHSIDEDGSGKTYDSVAFSLNYEQDVIKKCVEAIPEAELKLDVDNKYIENKTVEMIEIISKGKILEAMSFIRSFINELQEKIK